MSLNQFPGSNLFFFSDQAALTAGGARVPNATWNNGANVAGNSPGVGIASTGSLQTGQHPNWTLADQFGVARTPQISQVIGGLGISGISQSDGLEGNGAAHGEVITQGDNSDEGTGEIVSSDGAAYLQTLAAGWVPL